MSLSSAYLLTTHGSRDPRPQQAMEKLAERVRSKLRTQEGTWKQSLDTSQGPSIRIHDLSFHVHHGWQRCEVQSPAKVTTVVNNGGYPLVGTATLELADIPLHEQIRQFASLALADGCNQLQVLPLFLLPGVHVREDIPTEVALAQECLGKAVAIAQRPHLGAHPGLGRLLAMQWATLNADAKILLSHGSRRTGGNEPVEVIAKQLGAVAAYWSVPPSLEEQVQRLALAGHRQIAILPYFLFSGGITDAIARRVSELQVQFPKLQLSLGEPMGASAELATLIVDLIKQ
ncbi:MAG: sirohydrochlorin chelatase [Cyanobacteriota bacterium]